MPSQLLLAYDFPPLGGGIARWMGELAARYPAGSLVVSTGRVNGSGPVDVQFPNVIDRLPVPSRRLRAAPGLVRWSVRAAALAKAIHPEFIWCGNIKPAAYPASWIKYRTGIPYGVLVHGGDLLIVQRQAARSTLKRRVIRALLGQAAVVVANSQWTRDLCRGLLEELQIQRDSAMVRTVPLGSDPVLFRPGLDQTRSRSRYDMGGRKWLLSVARLTRHKGIDIGIRVLAMLRNLYPDLGYAVVGSGSELATLQSLARELGVEDRVRFLGSVPDNQLPAVYNTGTIYLGLSRLMQDRVEGFGISLSEAAASGLPAVGSRTGGITEAVRDGETGLLVDPDNIEEVCRAVRTLLDNPERAREMGAAGRRAVETYYNWDRVAADLMRIGHELGSRSTWRSHDHDDRNDAAPQEHC
jgi:phosphatidylinositol alpha-1,6-mannosyltransferase